MAADLVGQAPCGWRLEAGGWRQVPRAKYRVKRLLFTALFFSLITLCPQHAEAGIASGLLKIVAGVIELPRAILAGTFSGPPIVGTAMGVVVGAFNTVGLLAGGAIELVGSAVPLALKAAPLIPIFI